MLEVVAPNEALLREQALGARKAARKLASTSTAQRDQGLRAMAAAIRLNAEEILTANAQDVKAGEASGMSRSLLDRLSLNPARVEDMAKGAEEVALLADPLGRETSWRRPNGLLIRKVQVPLGVLCMIYEARPNVTVESASLALKSGNACLLRGSRSAEHSNAALVRILRAALEGCGLPADAICAVADTSRESIDVLARLNGAIDCIIPRGGADLINRVIQAATVPVIETGVGNCHLYVHSAADLAMALELTVNSKCSRPAVCNSLETVLVDQKVAPEFLASLDAAMPQVELRGCERTRALITRAKAAEEWDEEHLDFILRVKIVDGLDEALDHIARHGSSHTEAIVTQDLNTARRFQLEVDACAVNVNASTRFTDGGQFGFGAEIGISTQKLHARGPLGLAELTTSKYLVEGDGHVRP